MLSAHIRNTEVTASIRVILIFQNLCEHCMSSQHFPISASGLAAMLATTVPTRCCGTTKSGQRCSITSSSSMTDSLGRLVADPLRKGSAFCTLHTVLFCVEPTQVRDPLVVYMDLETNSLDVLSGKIVEIPRRSPRFRFLHCRKPRTGRKYRSTFRSWYSTLRASVRAKLF